VIYHHQNSTGLLNPIHYFRKEKKRKENRVHHDMTVYRGADGKDDHIGSVAGNMN
jgi:hypothetical protein